MCDCATPTTGNHPLTGIDGPRLSRRTALGGIGAFVAGMTSGCSISPAPARSPSSGGHDGTELVLLGTAGGPQPDRSRHGISSAVVVAGKVYLIDAGRSALTQYVTSGLRLADLAAVFLTHLHADHIADYYNFFLLGGAASPGTADTTPDRTPIYGPGRAGGLPEFPGGGQGRTQSPADPAPGLADLTEHCNNAYAYSTNVFMRDSGIRETSSLIDVHEVLPPAAVGANYTNTAPAMQPFTVMEDDRVKVSAVLVPHGPVFPAYAYRFDTDHGAITFSGDTTYTDNIPVLARGSEILVHEAINIEGFAGDPRLTNHLLDSHVEVQKVGAIASKAEVPQLVLSHIGDLTAHTLDPRRWRNWAQQGYEGRVTVGSDLQRFMI